MHPIPSPKARPSGLSLLAKSWALPASVAPAALAASQFPVAQTLFCGLLAAIVRVSRLEANTIFGATPQDRDVLQLLPKAQLTNSSTR